MRTGDEQGEEGLVVLPAPAGVLVALSQSGSAAGDVVGNVARHVAVIRAAVSRGAGVVVFPELSLTGYELVRIAAEPELLVTPMDPRLAPLSAVTAELGVTAVVGAPLSTERGRHVASLIFESGEVRPYPKRNLFGREQSMFVCGENAVHVEAAGVRLAVGICADLADDRQVRELASLRADAWVLSVLLTPDGYGADARRAADVAAHAGIPVLLANHATSTGGWNAAGGSGVWWPTGEALRLDDQDEKAGAPTEGLLLVPVRRRTE